MVRRFGIVLAVLAGAAVALLIATDVHATYDGKTVSCTTVITAAAVDVQGVPGSQAACHDALVDRTALAGLALLVCIVAGTAVTASRPAADRRRVAMA
jgi:hypothetical protein